MTLLIDSSLTIESILQPIDDPHYLPSLFRYDRIQFSSHCHILKHKLLLGLYDISDHGRAIHRSIRMSSLDYDKSKEQPDSANPGAYYGYTDSISVASARPFTEFDYSRTLDGVKLLIVQMLNLALLT